MPLALVVAGWLVSSAQKKSDLRRNFSSNWDNKFFIACEEFSDDVVELLGSFFDHGYENHEANIKSAMQKIRRSHYKLVTWSATLDKTDKVIENADEIMKATSEIVKNLEGNVDKINEIHNQFVSEARKLARIKMKVTS